MSEHDDDMQEDGDEGSSACSPSMAMGSLERGMRNSLISTMTMAMTMDRSYDPMDGRGDTDTDAEVHAPSLAICRLEDPPLHASWRTLGAAKHGGGKV